jgi:hypothetical protein
MQGFDMLPKYLVKELKQSYHDVKNDPDPEECEPLDQELIPFLDEINKKEGICTVFSCGGHYDYQLIDGIGWFWRNQGAYMCIGYQRGKCAVVRDFLKRIKSKLPQYISNHCYISYFNVPYLGDRSTMSFHYTPEAYFHPKPDADVEKQHENNLKVVREALETEVFNWRVV